MPNSVNVARYASFIWQKSPTNCRIHLSESNFQTRSSLSTKLDFPPAFSPTTTAVFKIPHFGSADT
ncbi:DUF6783 domain-containing protein [Lachnospiraceae bacterium JLR.KK009]